MRTTHSKLFVLKEELNSVHQELSGSQQRYCELGEALAALEDKKRQVSLELSKAFNTLEALTQWHEEYKKSQADIDE